MATQLTEARSLANRSLGAEERVREERREREWRAVEGRGGRHSFIRYRSGFSLLVVRIYI